jgi:nucleoside-triphosphatase
MGKPGVGKTTLVQKIVEGMGEVCMAGFYTAEIRSEGSRLGFELCGLDGKRGTLAHVDIRSRHRVGRYGVDTAGFEAFLETLDLLNPEVELVVIDEIGKMELFSNRFRGLVRDVLDSDKEVLATIPWKGDKFVQEIKRRADTRLFEVTADNRDRLPADLVEHTGHRRKKAWRRLL